MTRLAVLLIALAAALPCHGQTSEATPQFECLDKSGRKVMQDRPCGENTADFRAEHVPLYVWGIVALLGLIWLIALLPDRKPRARAPVVSDPLPGVDLAPLAASAPTPTPSATPVTAPARPPKPIARPQPVVLPRAATLPQPGAAKAAAPARPAAWSLETIRDLDGKRLEHFVLGLWQINGHKADLSGKSADGGAEIKIHGTAGGRLFAVAQCRPARSGLLGAGAVGGLWDVVQQQGATLGIFYGLAGFAPEALAFAQGKRLKLVSPAELLAQLGALRPEQQKTLLDHVWRQG